MSLVLKEHGLLTDEISDEIRRTVHLRFAPLIAAIKAQDDEAAREALLNMKTPTRIM